jgi:hypothetical protein
MFLAGRRFSGVQSMPHCRFTRPFVSAESQQPIGAQFRARLGLTTDLCNAQGPAKWEVIVIVRASFGHFSGDPASGTISPHLVGQCFRSAHKFKNGVRAHGDIADDDTGLVDQVGNGRGENGVEPGDLPLLL